MAAMPKKMQLTLFNCTIFPEPTGEQRRISPVRCFVNVRRYFETRGEWAGANIQAGVCLTHLKMGSRRSSKLAAVCLQELS